MVLKQKAVLASLVLITLIFTACAVEENPALRVPSSDEKDLSPTPIPSPVPERILSICLGAEPSSLFIYGDLSDSAQMIRQAIYDGPVDQVDFQQSSPLLKEIPSQENNLVEVNQVEVLPGDQIVDSSGNRTILASGVKYRPAGCLQPSCVEVFDNQDTVIMDQVEITFPLEDGIKWSDGTILTAGDSEFSFQVARHIFGSKGPRYNKYTSSYQATNPETLLWKGLPGFHRLYAYPEYFFSPLPSHLLGDSSLDDFINSEIVNQIPLGWGPYKMVEWIPGDHITLVNNPHYLRNSEGLPFFDALVFRFVTGGEEALAAFFAGECQIVANEPEVFDYVPELLEGENAGELQLNYIKGTAWEQISFGVNSLDPNRIYLEDSRTRQAIAYCINRTEIAELRVDVGEVVDGLFPPGDPNLPSRDLVYEYQPDQGAALLDEVGWIDHDQDVATARVSREIKNLRDDIPLRLTILIPETDQAALTAEHIQKDLSDCGIEISIEVLPPSDLFAPGQDGPIFGRSFDLALFAWDTGPYHRCQLFLTDEIPGPAPRYPKGWGGTNATGFSNQGFDIACRELIESLPDTIDLQIASSDVQDIFRENIPALAMFFRHQIYISSPELEGLGSGYFHPFWNIELIQ